MRSLAVMLAASRAGLGHLRRVGRVGRDMADDDTEEVFTQGGGGLEGVWINVLGGGNYQDRGVGEEVAGVGWGVGKAEEGPDGIGGGAIDGLARGLPVSGGMTMMGVLPCSGVREATFRVLGTLCS